MKLLVFAHTPPPVHGQSVMVATLVDGFRGDPDIQILHVNAQLSDDNADIGRWRVGKLFRLLGCCVQAWWLRLRHGPAVFYYVPAPGKRSALYRDFVVMLLCRPVFPRVVLHWHAAGLGEWVVQRAYSIERRVSLVLLGDVELSIVLGESLRADAAVFQPKRIAIVRNGIADPCTGYARSAQREKPPFEAIFLGLCSHEKGLFAAIAGVREHNIRLGSGSQRRVHLRVAGEFPDPTTAREFADTAKACDGAVEYVGFVGGVEKERLLASADALIFPTAYPHETQGLVVAEALAHDLPIIVTRWRSVHEGLPGQHVYFVEGGRADQIADALTAVQRSERPDGALRRHFLSHFTVEKHLNRMREELLPVEQGGRKSLPTAPQPPVP